MIRKEQLIEVSPKYGVININCVHFNDIDYFKEKDDILNYKIIKIKIWTGKIKEKDVISGIQFIYKNIFTGKIVTPEKHVGSNEYINLNEIELGKTEYLVNFEIRIDTEVTQIKLTTNLNNIYSFGGECGEVKINDLNVKNYIVLCPMGSTRENLESCGFWYIDKKLYLQKHLIGYINLRILLRNREDFKQKVKNSNITKNDQILVRACSMPGIIFTTILKYCLF